MALTDGKFKRFIYNRIIRRVSIFVVFFCLACAFFVDYGPMFQNKAEQEAKSRAAEQHLIDRVFQDQQKQK